MKRLFVLLAALSLSAALQAQVPQILSYQGHVAVNGTFDSGVATTHNGAFTNRGVLGAWDVRSMHSANYTLQAVHASFAMPGAPPVVPPLRIALDGGMIRVFWPDPQSTFVLEDNLSLEDKFRLDEGARPLPRQRHGTVHPGIAKPGQPVLPADGPVTSSLDLDLCSCSCSLLCIRAKQEQEQPLSLPA